MSMYCRMSEHRLDHIEAQWWWLELSNELALENTPSESEGEDAE